MRHADEQETISRLKQEEHIRWIESLEFEQAFDVYVNKFKYSEEYRNARLLYRRRINCSPSSETT